MISLTQFIKKMCPFELDWEPHHELLCNEFEYLVNNKSKLALTLPVRSGKTLICQYGLLWAFGRDPSIEILTLTGNSRLLDDWLSNIVIPIFKKKDESHQREEFFKIFPLCRDITFELNISKCSVRSSLGGCARFATVKASYMGLSADYIIVDDLISKYSDIDTEEKRDKLFNNVTSSIFTRVKNGKAGIAVICTRWHEDDLIGRLIKQDEANNTDKWKVLNIPAFALEDDILGRKPEQILWESRLKDFYIEQWDALGELALALLQGKPMSDKDESILNVNNIEYYNELSKDKDYFTFLSIDLACSLASSADFTVILVCHLDKSNGHIYIDKKSFVGRVTILETIQKIYELHSILDVKSIVIEGGSLYLSLHDILMQNTDILFSFSVFNDKVNKHNKLSDINIYLSCKALHLSNIENGAFKEIKEQLIYAGKFNKSSSKYKDDVIDAIYLAIKFAPYIRRLELNPVSNTERIKINRIIANKKANTAKSAKLKLLENVRRYYVS